MPSTLGVDWVSLTDLLGVHVPPAESDLNEAEECRDRHPVVVDGGEELATGRGNRGQFAEGEVGGLGGGSL